MSHGCPLDRWTGQDSRTSLSHGGPLDRLTGQDSGTTCSVRVGCPMDVPWMSIGQVDWTGQWDKSGL